MLYKNKKQSLLILSRLSALLKDIIHNKRTTVAGDNIRSASLHRLRQRAEPILVKKKTITMHILQFYFANVRNKMELDDNQFSKILIIKL